MRINISVKLFLGFLVVILLNFFYVVVVLKLTDLNSLATIVKKQNILKNYLLQLTNLHGRQNRSRTAYEGLPEQRMVDNFNEASLAMWRVIDSIKIQLSEIRKLDSAVSKRESNQSNIRVPETLEEMLLSKVAKNISIYQKGFEKLVSIKSTASSSELAQHKKLLDNARDRLLEEIKAADTYLEEQSSILLRIIEERINKVIRMTLVILISVTVFAVVFGFTFSRIFTNSLRRLKESASSIAKGNFNFSPAGYPKDEIGDLALAFFEMAYDLKNTQEELIKSKRLAAIGEVVASVNHEINNPLMIISGNAQFLEMSMQGYPEEMRERVRTILDETERISSVTRKLREIKNPVVEDYTSSGEQMINLDKSST